jgi:hypothetical protein
MGLHFTPPPEGGIQRIVLQPRVPILDFIAFVTNFVTGAELTN